MREGTGSSLRLLAVRLACYKKPDFPVHCLVGGTCRGGFCVYGGPCRILTAFLHPRQNSAAVAEELKLTEPLVRVYLVVRRALYL